MKIMHWYDPELELGEKTLCGVPLSSAAWHMRDKSEVTCKRCLHGLKRGWGKKCQ